MVVVLSGCVGRAAVPAGGVEVLGARTIWRFHTTYRPFGGNCAKALELKRTRWVRWGEELAAPLPAAGWERAGFDDSGWPRRRGPFFGGYGSARWPGTALLCLRVRFGVVEPSKAKGVTLELAYRGGVVVFVNGTEVARGHVPDGEIAPLTPATDYPREVYVTPDGEALLPDYGRRKPPAELLPRFEARIRRARVAIPPAALRQGTNVLAVAVHRAQPPTDLPLNGKRVNWETAGLLEATLTAAAGSGLLPNPPAGAIEPHAWTAGPLLRVGVDADRGDPFEPVPPIRLAAPRNGLASGQAVVTAPPEPNDYPYPTVAAGPLTGPGGREIPASAVRIRFARSDDELVALFDTPADLAAARLPIRRRPAAPDENAPQQRPVWVTVRVPPDAKPGRYTGEITLSAPGVDARVPIDLTVHGWRLGDPAEWKCSVNLLQSPESVAGHYGVALWSDRHFERMASSFDWMGRAGNDVLGVSAVGKTVFGDDPLVVFRERGGRLVPDLSLLKRYLALYSRRAGRPRFLSVQVWHYGMYLPGRGRDGSKRGFQGPYPWRAKTIPLVVRRGGRLVGVEAPIYGEPGTEETWRGVVGGLRRIVRELGWGERCLLLGTSGDCWVGPETVAFFQKVAPGVPWRAISHGGGVPRWGPTAADRTQPNGMVVGYCELARRITNFRHKRPDVPVACNSRDCVHTDPFQFRSLPGCNVISANFDGFCWKGMDYWTYLRPDGTRRSALNADVHFGNIVGGTPRAILQPGPNGAVATAQYEMLREGIQDCEAMILLRDAIRDAPRRAKLGEALAGRCENVLNDLLALLETGHRYAPHGGGDVRRHVDRLYAAAAEAARALGAVR